MNFTIDIVRASERVGERDHFACNCNAWELLLEIGKSFGWKPHGTTYVVGGRVERPSIVALHDYQPGDRRDAKRVDADDAVAWAEALSEARRSPHLAAMVHAQRHTIEIAVDVARCSGVPSANVPIASVMNEFIEYALGGAFLFARAG